MVPTRVLIADDHALFRGGLRSMLRLQPGITIVGEVERADDIMSTLDRVGCDLLLLDLQMERSVLVDIAPLARRVTVVVVTASERHDDALAAIAAGARGLVFKTLAIEFLVAAIHAVMDGHVWMPPALQTLLTARLQEPVAIAMTPREREIVRHVALGLRNAEVAERLRITEVTVKSHLNSIFQKLRVRDRVELALYALRMGLVGLHERRS